MPSRTPEAIGEAAAEEVHRLEEAVGALGEESPRSKPLLDAFRAAKAKVNVPISVQIDSTRKYLERARKRLVQAVAEVTRVAAQKVRCVADVEAAKRRLEPVELVLLQSRIDDLVRERDSLRVSADQGHVEVAALSNAEEVNMLRANVDSLECERAMFRAEVGRCRGECRPVSVDVDFERPRRHTGEGEWVEPVQPIEAVTRDSRYGLRAVRVGEASHPGPPMALWRFRSRPSAN